MICQMRLTIISFTILNCLQFSFQIKLNQLKCWFLERGENRSTRRKTSRSRVENQQTQPTYDAESKNRTRDTFEGERSHHYANPAPLSTFVTARMFGTSYTKTVKSCPISKNECNSSGTCGVMNRTSAAASFKHERINSLSCSQDIICNGADVGGDSDQSPGENNIFFLV